MSNNDVLIALLTRVPVIPVLTLTDPDKAILLARALVAGGLDVLEVTLRTKQALKSIEAIAREVPEAKVGAGTVLTPSQVDESMSAGAHFLVSPGSTRRLSEAAAIARAPLLPGVATASEAMAMAEMGHHVLKFFPAEPAGGVAYLRSLAAPLPHLKFCPTGGIDPVKAKSYLTLSNVVCVGGSWVTPTLALDTDDWSMITRLACECAALRS